MQHSVSGCMISRIIIRQGLFILIVLSLSILSSCKKDENSGLTGTYQSGQIIDIGNLRMFTKDGEVTDRQTIIDRIKNTNNNFFQIDGNTAVAEDTLTINITAAGLATINSKKSSQIIQAELVKRSNTEYILSDLDTTTTVSSNESNNCTSLSELVLRILPDETCYYVGAGTASICKFRKPYPLEIEDGRVYVPLLTWMVFSSNSGSYCSYTQNEWNIFKEIPDHSLTGENFVIVQQNKLFLTRIGNP